MDNTLNENGCMDFDDMERSGAQWPFSGGSRPWDEDDADSDVNGL